MLATDIDHNSPSLLLFVDKEGRLLFNAGEGLQRMFRENKLRMQKVWSGVCAHVCVRACTFLCRTQHWTGTLTRGVCRHGHTCASTSVRLCWGREKASNGLAHRARDMFSCVCVIVYVCDYVCV